MTSGAFCSSVRHTFTPVPKEHPQNAHILRESFSISLRPLYLPLDNFIQYSKVTFLTSGDKQFRACRAAEVNFKSRHQVNYVHPQHRRTARRLPRETSRRLKH